MIPQFSRTELLFGTENMQKLAASRVAVFGLGGVGSYTVEALVRSGIGAIDIIDNDVVSLSNINRQLYALHSTVGQYKADAALQRIRDIAPDCTVTVHKVFFMPETAGQFDFSQYDYVADCIDTVTGKIEIIMQAKKADIPVISCMGAGNKLDPLQFEIADISATSVCPLARVMRRELKARGIAHVKVLFSREKACTPTAGGVPDGSGAAAVSGTAGEHIPGKKQIPGSTAFVPSVAGLIIAGEIIKDLTGAAADNC